MRMSNPEWELSETFCPYPWSQISMYPTQELAVCCWNKAAQSGAPLTAFLNSSEVIQLRRDLLGGRRAASCELCWKTESNGGHSARQMLVERECGKPAFRERVKNSLQNDLRVTTPLQMDVKLGTTCNLMCRMCVPSNSSKIWSEYSKNSLQFTNLPNSFESSRSYYEAGAKVPTTEELLAASQSIRRLNIAGGEPALQKGILQYLQALCESGLSNSKLGDVCSFAPVSADGDLPKHRRHRAGVRIHSPSGQLVERGR
jgi:hypothetical protein